MKKLIFASIAASLIFVSCSKSQDAQTEVESNVMLPEPSESTSSTEEAVAASPEEQGKKLLEGMDCLSCHKVDSKLVGPSYEEVAAKYTEADIDMLATKIIDGGKGNWGEIPMTPHAGMSPDNAKLMVKYILSLKK